MLIQKLTWSKQLISIKSTKYLRQINYKNLNQIIWSIKIEILTIFESDLKSYVSVFNKVKTLILGLV